MGEKLEKAEDETKKKRRRRSKPIQNKLKNCKTMFLNIRGLKSKLSAVNELLETENPTMMCLVETHLKKEDDIGFDGYTLFRNERESKDGGGILVAIKNELKNVAVEVEQEKENGESIWFVVDNKYKRWGTAIRFGVIYAPQESRTKLPEYKQMYKKIEEQVRIGKEKNQKIVLMGDFNCKVGLEIEGNKVLCTCATINIPILPSRLMSRC